MAAKNILKITKLFLVLRLKIFISDKNVLPFFHLSYNILFSNRTIVFIKKIR